MIYEKAYAKINLALDVNGKRNDGYHDLKMINIPIELHDELTFQECDQLILESDFFIEDNAVIKAAKELQSIYKIKQGAKISLKKNIPIGAGLAGGSADIAATLRGLNRLWGLNLSLKELEIIALSLGSDTLFCLYNQPAFVYGRGENLIFLEHSNIKDIYLFPFEQQIITKNVFLNHKILSHTQDFDANLSLYINKKYEKFYKTTYNDLEKTTLSCYPLVKQHQKNVKKIDKGAMMSGSGATYFILNFQENNKKLENIINKRRLFHIKTKPKI